MDLLKETLKETKVKQLFQCSKCRFLNTKHKGCNYDAFMREMGVNKKHKINEEGDCSGFTKK